MKDSYGFGQIFAARHGIRIYADRDTALAFLGLVASWDSNGSVSILSVPRADSKWWQIDVVVDNESQARMVDHEVHPLGGTVVAGHKHPQKEEEET